MTNKQNNSPPSKILLDELYQSEDEQFLDLFVQFESYEFLKHFSMRWMEDDRPWARKQFIEYLHGTLNHAGHEVVFKRTLKLAIERGDDELLVHFMVVLDGLVRRKRTTSYVYDYRTRQSYRREYLFAKSNRTVRVQTGRFYEHTYRKQTYRTPIPDILNRPQNRLFTQKTRAHLRRRVWRYFRFMSYQDAKRYVDAMVKAFSLYDNSFFSSGESILDNWSLMHAGFYHAPEIAFTPSHTNIVQGQALSNLKPSPYQPAIWDGDEIAIKLWSLLGDANSQFVRLWTIGMLRQKHSDWLSKISIEDLVQLLSCSDATVGEFAVELFRNHASLAHVEMVTWLRLLQEADFAVLSTLCDAMQKHIDPNRLSDDQLIEMTMARPAAVASMGLAWLQERQQTHRIDPDKLAKLSASKCVWESEKIADWALEQLATSEAYSTERFVQFFDSPTQPVRRSACKWLESAEEEAAKNSETFQHDPVLWAKLSETPYDEVRFSLVRVLGGVLDRAPKRFRDEEIGEGLSLDHWMRVYCAVVLCVDRGSRTKPKAIKQLARIAEQDPQRCESVMRVLAIAARSIRDPERVAALSAIATLLQQNPELLEIVSRYMPEWNWCESDNGLVATGEDS
ncbi:hypothetical protein SH528x_005216 [Novipirellula sp. SH528]|uniref:hypothetical protein n=1 Tax=Novipirellula sp. SH528 TaxID=3454466 RepID=UPI003FA07612